MGTPMHHAVLVGRVNLVNHGFIKKVVVLLCDIYMYRNQKKTICEDPSTLGTFFVVTKSEQFKINVCIRGAIFL
jgi:hypothetical protein